MRKRISELYAAALFQQSEVVNGEGVTGEGFGKFLIDYVIDGGSITTSETTVTLSETVLCFKDDLYEINETILPIPHNMISATLYIDFMPEFGFTIAPTHPSAPYLPMYQLVTDAIGNVASYSDQRGPIGDMRFKPQYTTAVFPSVENAIDDAEAATVAANTAAAAANAAGAGVETAITNADTAAASANTAAGAANSAATAANTAKTGADTAAGLANAAATAANTAKTGADTAAASASTAAGSANTAATAANTAAGAANTAKTNADNATSAANTAAGAANTAATAANTAKTDADTAAASANTATTSANTAAENAYAATEAALLTALDADTAAASANTAAGAANSAATAANTAADNANDAATTTRLNYLVPVTNFADLATTYPTPAVGDVVQVSSENKHYRWNGSAWAFISDFNLSGAESVSNKGVPNGYAGLDGTGKVPAAQLPPTGAIAHATTHVTGGSDVIPNAVAAGNSGLMTGADKTKLDGIATGANNYVHPTGDGSSHVPATSTTNNLRVLKAGATANSAAWGNVDFSEVTSKPTTLSGYGITDAAPSSHVGAGGTAHANVIAAGAAGFMTGADKTKLDGIAAGATNYVHPANHPPSIITQDLNNRFVTDAEKTTWNAKASTAQVTTTTDGLMIAADKSKLDGVAAGATNYVHPANHPPSIITQDLNNRFVTDAEKTTWNGKLNATDYTASDVRTKLLTVDGTGSGLDADMVDGFHFRVSGGNLQYSTDGTTWNGNPAVRVYNNANQSIPNNTITTVNFNNEFYDTNNMHDNVTENYKLVCKSAGRYRITASVLFAINATGRRELYLMHNGGTQIAYEVRTPLSGATPLHLSTTYDFALNDYVIVNVFQDGGAALNIIYGFAYSPVFMMEKIGP